MTYVAEPYLAVTDQVLTALTGGVARETHRFFPAANAFAFEVGADRVLGDTVRVLGEANNEFVAFELNRDFTVGRDGILRFTASNDDPLQPAKGATWPDEGSEFYVGYYHLDSGKAPLTDRNVGSITRTLGEAFARELTVLRKQLEFVYNSAFVDTAEGPALDMVVALLGIERQTREHASGAVRFVRDSPAPADVFIPAGTVVSTALPPAGAQGAAAKKRPVPFETIDDRTLRRGQLSVEVPIRAQQKGPDGVVDAGAISVINQPILGINRVTNEAPTVFGASGETDDQLRARAKRVSERTGSATPRAIIEALTEIGGIRENDVRIVEELALRPGVVQVSVATKPNGGSLGELAVDVQQAILSTRAAGIRVENNLESFLPSTTATPVSSGDVGDDGVTDASGAAPGSGDDFAFPVCADVLVFAQDPRVAGAERQAIVDAATAAVTAAIDESTVGGTLVFNRIVADLMTVGGVADIVLNLAPKPAEQTEPCQGKRNIRLPQGRRAQLATGDLTIRFAGAPVTFTFQVRVAPKNGSTVDDIRKEIKTKLVDLFAARPAAIVSAEVLAALGTSELYEQPAEDDVSWTAEFETAGLTVREPGGPGSSTAVSEEELAVLGDVQVAEKG